MRWEIIVSLRMAASAEAPLFPMPLFPILQSMGKVGAVREQVCQWALTRKQTLWGGGALEVGDLCLLEHSSERGGSLVSDVVSAETAR